MYVFESRVRYSEVDAEGRLTPEKLIDYFQDCSTFQSEDIDAGVGALRKRHLAWIIVYWRVEILRMPGLGERIRIGTLPYQMKGGIGLRNFLMESGEGEMLARANSVWTLIDTRTMRPVRIPEEIREKYSLEERIDMEYDARKLHLPEMPEIRKEPIVVQEYHLDTNRHMNNSQYVRIAAGYLPPETDLSLMRIEYRRQAVLGDKVTPTLYGLEGKSGEGSAGNAGRQAGTDMEPYIQNPGKNKEERIPHISDNRKNTTDGGQYTPDERQNISDGGQDISDGNASEPFSHGEKTQKVWISLNDDDAQPYALLEIGIRSRI